MHAETSASDAARNVRIHSSVHSMKTLSTVPAGTVPLRPTLRFSAAPLRTRVLSLHQPKSNSTGVAAPPEPAADTLLCTARIMPTGVPGVGAALYVTTAAVAAPSPESCGT